MDTKKGAGVHAEEEALLKLKTNTKRVKMSINVVVIRVSTTNRLQPSKPCEKLWRLAIAITSATPHISGL